MLILSDKVVCIGCTERTQPGAIEFVAANLFKKGFEAVYAFEMERGRNAMHLDGMLTMVDRDAFLFNPFLSGNVNVYKLTPRFRWRQDAARRLRLEQGARRCAW